MSTSNLKILQDTFFKILPADSSSLSDQQKIRVAAGQTLSVNQYERVDGHLKVQLSTPLSPVGSTGFLYQNHVQIAQLSPTLKIKQADPNYVPPGYTLITITQNTKLKTQPQDSALLSDLEKLDVAAGESFYVLGYACVNGHFQFTFDETIPNFGNRGYLYSLHVQVKKDGAIVPFNPNSVNLTIIQSTVFKKRPVASTILRPEEKITLPAGLLFGVTGYLTESNHLKVSISENIPGFGNTGYFFIDHVTLSRGSQVVITSPVLTYNGPKEVLVNQTTILSGSYNPQQIARVLLVAEDIYPFTVTLDTTSKTWQSTVTGGFKQAGARWLRIRGLNAQGQVVESQIIYLNVSSDSSNLGETLTLKVTTDTFFKLSPTDSSKLNSQQKVLVKAGQTYSVTKYGYVDGHLKLNLTSSISPVGNFGYFYEDHVQLSKGNQVLVFDIADVPNTNLSAQLLVVNDTYIKAKPVDSSALATNQKAELLLGQTYAITGYASTQGHFRITLAESIPNFGNVGYIYWQHIQIKKSDKVIPYDPDALTLTILQTTVFKKKPVDASQLSSAEKTTLPLGRIYGVDSYRIASDHILASLTEEFAGFGNTGYIFPRHVQMQRGGKTFDPFPSQIELNVPYFSQRDNPRFYWSTCNVTSVAMVFYYYGVRSSWGGQLEDELLQWCFNNYGQGSETEHAVLSQLIRAYGFNTSFSTTRRWSEVKNELINKRPVVLAGDYTATGHVLTVIGYNSQGWIVNDPWGDAYTGYSNTEGRKLLYSYGYTDQMSGPDGNVWAHFIWK
jgi:uncharacterized protein YvpB